MTGFSIATATADALEVDPGEFQTAVEEDAEALKTEIDEGAFNNPQGIVGLEYEFYAATSGEGDMATTGSERGALRRIPRRLLELIGFEKELGLHNAEMSTSPQPMNEYGLAAQTAEVQSRLSAALERTQAEDISLASDGIWTIPPVGETTREYLRDSVLDEGVRIAVNMSDAVRYHAMANTERSAGMRIDVPNVTFEADTIMPESLITSIQPHYQIPNAGDLAEYYQYAIRVAGPLLALGVNSPFLPPDLYDDVSPGTILEDAWMENRISVFETTMNGDDAQKVRFPRDVTSTEEAVDRIVEDATFVPMTVEKTERYDDEFAHFRLKHGTYWRWVRPVFGGPTRSDANVRVEFRPLPSQPTIRDTIAFQAVFAGLIERMHAGDHPVADLDWEDARSNFYSAMREGLDAEMRWITADGVPTTDIGVIYDDLFGTATDGLIASGIGGEELARYLEPLRVRVRRHMTPARWKRRAVRRRIDGGDDFEQAVHGMQREYFDRQAETLMGGSFADWITR